MGNEALGRGLVEAGCTLAASYPGTPASEILESVVRHARETDTEMHIEWSLNEKVAYEVALAHSYTGKRSAVAMKQVGLNVASDPFMRSAYLGVRGGMVVIVADDPGPHSSQTEQDSRLFALFARVPVFDPATPAEAKGIIAPAFALSEEFEIPVMVRPTTRVCHARQNVACEAPHRLGRSAHFEKDPGRWVATPRFLTRLHGTLNGTIAAIARDRRFYPRLMSRGSDGGRRCIVASGVACAHTCDILRDLGLWDAVDLYKVDLPFPLNEDFIAHVQDRYEDILVLEETYPTVEMQLLSSRVTGRRSGNVPGEGELTPDIVEEVLRDFLDLVAAEKRAAAESPGVAPTLCAGCPHRAAFYTIKKTFPRGIFPSDIGCYTLGMNLGAVDTCHCMGACISQGAGFYHAYTADGGDFPTVVVTIGDSTFFHAGIPALANAVFNGARMIVVILDNATTAMTGNQPTPAVGIRADGTAGRPIPIPGLVAACGVSFLRECDPYDMDGFAEHLRDADRYIRSDEGGVAVIIAAHPCIMDRTGREKQAVYTVTVTDECTGCRLCVEEFECPGLVYDDVEGRVFINDTVCIGCGLCETVCPVGAITVTGGGR